MALVTVTVTVSGIGQVVLDPPGDQHESGVPFYLTAYPGRFSRFGSWTVNGAGAGSDPSLLLTPVGATAVIATFIDGTVPARVTPGGVFRPSRVYEPNEKRR